VRRAPDAEAGIAVMTVLIVAGLVGVVAFGLALMASVEHLTARNHRASVALLHAAEGGIELAARALAQSSDWDGALAGSVQASGADGPPTGWRDLGAGSGVDLDRQTHLVNCGHPGPCTEAELAAITPDRPWGADNPRWTLFLYGWLASFGPVQYADPAYLLVWIADDMREADSEPLRDGPDARRGRGIVRVRADAVSRGGSRRAIEAELSRVCRATAAGPVCLSGIRVQSWRDLRHVVP
jgi:hypothetical protein